MYMPCVVWTHEKAVEWLEKTQDHEIYKLVNDDDLIAGYTVLPLKWAKQLKKGDDIDG